MPNQCAPPPACATASPAGASPPACAAASSGAATPGIPCFSVFPGSSALGRASASSRWSSSAIAVSTRCRRSSGMANRSTRTGCPGGTVAPGTRRGSGGAPLSSAMRPPPGRAPERTRAWIAEHTLLGQFNRNRSLSWANYLKCRIAREAAALDVSCRPQHLSARQLSGGALEAVWGRQSAGKPGNDGYRWATASAGQVVSEIKRRSAGVRRHFFDIYLLGGGNVALPPPVRNPSSA
jgi:hypothetical protein